MKLTDGVVRIQRGPYRIHAEVTAGIGPPIVLLHGFPDSTHLYDRLVPALAGPRPVVRFDFLGWGESDKPAGYPYTATNQVDDLAAVVDHLQCDRVTLVAHDASGPPAIDWALAHPERIERLVLLNTYYCLMPGLRRPPAIALYSTPVLRNLARAVVRRRGDLDRRLFAWQVGGFIRDAEVRDTLLPLLYAQFQAARPAFWTLNDDLIGTVRDRRRRLPDLRRFAPPVSIVFGAQDPYLGVRVARGFADLFPNNELHLIAGAGHYVQVDEPSVVAALIVGDGVR